MALLDTVDVYKMVGVLVVECKGNMDSFLRMEFDLPILGPFNCAVYCLRQTISSNLLEITDCCMAVLSAKMARIKAVYNRYRRERSTLPCGTPAAIRW